MTATTKSKANNKAFREKSQEYARKAVQKTFKDSTVLDLSVNYPKFDFSELTIGKVLGKGGFGTVSEVRGFDTSNETRHSKFPMIKAKSDVMHKKNLRDDEVEQGAMESRKFIADHCIRNGGDARYAVKVLSQDVIEGDPAHYLQGVIDMAIETRFLSNIEHPNIIKMRAMAKLDPYHEDYFIVMDRLYDTLEKRLLTWESRKNRCTGLTAKLTDRKGKKAGALYEERIVAAFDLSAAVEYLHSRKIIYRDLKPENVGFDIRGDIKIFDFGLAKELTDDLKNDDGTYKLTEMTGSPRYMAPEVANAEPYNATCDSYSFAILLWEMLALKRPYELYTPKSMRAKVYNGVHKRPPIDDSWHNSIKICLKRSWDKDLHRRNTMTQIKNILRKECVSIRNGDETGLEHSRRRSTFVFRPSAANGGQGMPQHTQRRSRAPALRAMAEEKEIIEEETEAPEETNGEDTMRAGSNEEVLVSAC